MLWEVSRVFLASDRTPAEGRAYLRGQLESHFTHPEARARTLVEDCELIVSELLTNSVNAGGRRICLRLSADDQRLDLAVVDDGQGTPQPRATDEHDTSGRGLHIVEALADRWGIDADGPTSRVWVQMALDVG